MHADLWINFFSYELARFILPHPQTAKFASPSFTLLMGDSKTSFFTLSKFARKNSKIIPLLWSERLFIKTTPVKAMQQSPTALPNVVFSAFSLLLPIRTLFAYNQQLCTIVVAYCARFTLGRLLKVSHCILCSLSYGTFCDILNNYSRRLQTYYGISESNMCLLGYARSSDPEPDNLKSLFDYLAPIYAIVRLFAIDIDCHS